MLTTNLLTSHCDDSVNILCLGTDDSKLLAVVWRNVIYPKLGPTTITMRAYPSHVCWVTAALRLCIWSTYHDVSLTWLQNLSTSDAAVWLALKALFRMSNSRMGFGLSPRFWSSPHFFIFVSCCFLFAPLILETASSAGILGSEQDLRSRCSEWDFDQLTRFGVGGRGIVQSIRLALV